MICIKCGKKNYAQPHNLRRNETTEENYMCFDCSHKYKHHHGKINMDAQYKIKYLAYLRVIKE
jgi:DNA-directed RNA polymerase subunit RPC12/RpoP